MNPAKLLCGSNIIRDAEKMVELENIQLAADERKRKILSFGVIGDGHIVFAPALAQSDEQVHENESGLAVRKSDTSNVVTVSKGTSSVMSIALPPGLGCLNTTFHLFIRHASYKFVEKFFDLANKFEILNSDGHCVLYAGETEERFGLHERYRNQGNFFDVTILGVDGTPVLSIISRKGITTVSDFHKVIGTCVDVSSPFSPKNRYSIRDWNMCEILTFQRANNGPTWEFDIINKEKSRIGQFSNNWSTSVPNYVGVDKIYGICFPLDMAVEEKAVLFGGLFTMYFQSLTEKEGDRKKAKCCAISTCVLIVLFFVFGIGFIAIALYLVLGH